MSRLIVVTGASAGIGKATAKRFAENNDKVLLIARGQQRLTQAVDEIHSSVPGADLEPLALDMSDVESAQLLQQHVRSTGLPVSGLMCCAGSVPAPAGADVKAVQTEWQDAIQSNVMTAVIAVEGMIPLMADGGSIVLYSSIAAYRGSGGSGGYGAAKAALHSYVHVLATRLGGRGISANAIAPGYIAGTDLFGDGLPDARENMLIRQTALGRAGDPADVAELSLYLCSKPGGYVTSQVLQVNGGSYHGV
ncbi:SDR family NAD(P)-dependent oxidoreductase [Streptomyces sp. NPDC059474]|uniref:SDR family NAD(P)-dependent oxidoreductase n=1 Tax=unclassified Streptomyces TaxID=2593676 RepID=UPI0033DB3117